MLSTRIFTGINRIYLTRSSVNQPARMEQRRHSSNKASNMRNLCQKIWDSIYPPSFPSQCLQLSSAVEQRNAFGISFPDRELAKAFITRYKNSEDFMTLYNSLRCREVMINHLLVTQEMHSRGLVPLVHGQAAIWMIPQHILRTLGFDHCQLLRLSDVDDLKESQEIGTMIDAEMRRRASHWLPFYQRITFFKDLDLQPEFRSRLLSVTIGLFHCEAKNSPLSFVFGGSSPRGPSSIPCRYPGNRNLIATERCKKIADRMIAEGMKQKGFSSEFTENLIKELQPLYDEAEKAEIGQLVVLGIPLRTLHRFAYHSETGGIPTGIPIHKVIESISSGSIPKEGCQARFVFCRESMNPATGIEVVNLMDKRSIQRFIGSLECPPAIIEEALKALYSNAFEKDLERYRILNDRWLNQHTTVIDKLDRVMENLKNPHK